MKKITTGFVLAALAILLTGCSTTGPVSKVDKEQALRGRLQLATEYLRADNHKGARDHLQRALEIDNRSAEAHDLLALLYTKELEFDVADQHYRNAIKYDPKFTRARNNYGSFLYNRGRYREAYQVFTKGAEDLDYILRYEIFGKMGLCSLKLEQRDQARKNFEKAIALNQRWPISYLEMATIEYDDNNYAMAQRYFDAYSKLTKRPTARSLWLGIRLDDAFERKDARESKALALRNLFPDSEENLEYKNWQKNERQNRNQK